MTPRVRAGIALVLAALHLSGCSSWRPASVGDLSAVIARESRQGRIRITRIAPRFGDGRVELTRPVIRGDTIVDGSAVIPFSDVALVETRHFSAGKTLVLIVGVPVVIIAALAASFAIGCSSPDSRCGDFTGAPGS